MDGVYGGRQAVANWPTADDGCDPATNVAWYRELVAETAKALTRWREDEPERVILRRCDPRQRRGGFPRRDRRAC